jgi:hypothetical protein
MLSQMLSIAKARPGRFPLIFLVLLADKERRRKLSPMVRLIVVALLLSAVGCHSAPITRAAAQDDYNSCCPPREQKKLAKRVGNACRNVLESDAVSCVIFPVGLLARFMGHGG